ncbi:MAG: hypothetical protein JNM27_18495 [Leptospirales bacterium]|nr:hypothetical protein [Leptospirales bacterium]
MSVIEILDRGISEDASHKIKTKGEFEQAIAAYLARDFELAHALFTSVLRIHEHDPAASIYLSGIAEH